VSSQHVGQGLGSLSLLCSGLKSSCVVSRSLTLRSFKSANGNHLSEGYTHESRLVRSTGTGILGTLSSGEISLDLTGHGGNLPDEIPGQRCRPNARAPVRGRARSSGAACRGGCSSCGTRGLFLGKLLTARCWSCRSSRRAPGPLRSGLPSIPEAQRFEGSRSSGLGGVGWGAGESRPYQLPGLVAGLLRGSGGSLFVAGLWAVPTLGCLILPSQKSVF